MQGVLITRDDLVWLIWLEFCDKEIFEVNWCGAIVCGEWVHKINECPYKWNDLYAFDRHQSKFLERKAKEFPVQCDICNDYINADEFDKHRQICLKTNGFYYPEVHQWQLVKKAKSKNWIWNGSLLFYKGWAKYGTEPKKRTSKCYVCKDWGFYLCYQWVNGYRKSLNSGGNDLFKIFQRDTKFPFHVHPLTIVFGRNIREHVRKKWLGNLVEPRCKTKGSAKPRYFICNICGDLICEECVKVSDKTFK